jgi:drug/metabolite transporter (DMT)-like permease
MLRPGQALFGLASLFTLLAAFLYSAAQVLARKLGDSEAAPVITFIRPPF